MKYNFTESGVLMPAKGYSQQHKSKKDDKVLAFVQKIVNVIGLFFKPNNSHQTNVMHKESMTATLHGQLYAESSLQEYFIDKYRPQINKNKVKNVPDLIPNQDLTMNKLSLNSNSTVKEYHLGSHFDEKLKRWTPSFSSPKRIDGDDDNPKNSFFKGFATTILLVLISVLGVAAQSSIDLSLRKTINKSLPALNESIKYTLWLKNSGPSTANSIVVQENFPIGGAVLNTHTGGANFTYSPITGIGTWNVATLAVGDSVSLEINATVTQQGVFFNTAEVISIGANQEDTDSTPNNSKLYEDDIAAACFSVPLLWYPGEEYTVSVPAPYKYGATIKWFNGTTEITPSSTVATVNADSSLTIKAPGTFTFTTNVTSCPAQGCCAVQVVEGPYGSIGDYVWQDTNNDGKQGSTTTEPPVAGVKVYLLSATGTKLDSTVTDAQGKYLFDSLTTDSYRVQFVKPIGYDSFTTQNSGTDDTKDSDAGTTGLSQLINIDTSKLPSDTLRNNPNIDAGLKPNYGSIGDYVWSDVNNNGQQDSGEAPIAGVKVYLLSASGTKLDSTTTNNLGKYVFDTLASGSYKIQFVAPAGSIAAKQNTGADVTDSDANKNGMSQLITINTTKLATDTLRNNPQIDAGFVPVGSIGDYVFADNNSDGIQNTGDSPVSGIKVYLLDATTGAKLDSTVTNGAGQYLFDSLLAGNYKVKFVLPAGSEATGKLLGGDTTKDSNINPDGSTDAIVIDTTQPLGSTARNNTTIDAGIKTAFGSIGDYVWSDVNNNGQQDSGETPIAGVKVYLLSASGTKLDSTTTNNLGKYVFDTLASGSYKIQFVAPAGSIAAKQNTGADVTDSDANKNGMSQLITINTTKLATDTLRNNPQIDAGFVPVGSIGDYVFADNNSDGIQNTGDSPVSGIKVYLLDATTGAKLDSTVTNGAGQYLFDSLLAGNYKVKFVLPAGSEATGKLLGGDTTKDSNINPDGSTDAIVIDTTQPLGSTARNNTTIDAGIKTAFGSIGDYVWSDVNNNGQQDSGETPIAGVKVYLLSASGTKLDSTTTNNLGKYVFDTLASGSYKIQFVAPAGSIAAKQNTGADVTDSDANKNGMSQLITINTTKLATDTLRNNPQIDAGFVPVGSIGDYVFADNNGDGIQNTGDSPVSGIKVYLLDATTGAKLDSAITDVNGKYLFDSLLNGNYKVKFVIPAGSSITGKTLGGDPTKDSDANPDGTTDVISINTSLPVGNVGRNNTTVDAGIKTAFGSIGDFVWNDSNNNGLQDTGETGVGNVIIELYASDAIGLPIGAPLKKDTTDASGKYLFTGLPAGNYVVKLVTGTLPTGSQLTTKQDIGTNDAIDSDFNPSTGLSDKIVIDPYTPTKKDILTVDGGIYSPLGSIGDFVWKDTNNNGLQDTGEVGVEGVKLELYASDALGNPVGAAINTVTTNASGFYTFNNLPKGDYVVRIVTSTLPATYSLSTKVNAGDDTKDSDFNATSGYSPKISIDPLVPALKDNPTIDGAIYLPVVCSELIVINGSGSGICSGDTTSIRGTITGGGTVRWYLTPIGGTPIATTNSGAAYTIFPTTTTVYYAEIANAPEGCPNTRQPVAVVVNVRPANPSCVGAVEECIGKTINLNNYIINTVSTPGGSFEWHTTANPSSPLVANPTAVGDGTYYLFEKSGAGCYSNPTLLKVTLKNCEKSIDLSLTKTTDNTTPNVGDNITFTIKISNAGPDAATGVEVMDELPAGLQFVSSAFFANNSGVLTSTISNVAANQTITLTYIAKVTGSTAMTNFAQVTKTTEKDKDSTPGNGKTTKEDDDDKITITPKVVELLADLSLNKTVSNSTPATGEQITYYVEVKNNGTSNATNVEATDIVPAGLQIISATGGDGITTTGNTIVAKFNQINVGQTATFQIVAKVTATTGTIKNWAEVTKSDQKDPNSTPNNGVDKNENDDDDADITIKQQVCNPTTPLIACANPYICLGESVSIEAIGCNGTVVWSDGQTGNMVTVTPTATTTYTAQCKINDNCISGKSNPVQVVVNVIAPPTITSSSTSNVICNGGSVTLTANNCTGKILWSTGATTPSITVSPTATTSYTATCTKLSCVSNKSNVITVTVGTPTTPPTITADNNTVCVGQSVKLTANGCTGTVVWSNGSTGSSITFAPTSTGTYSAVCKVGECSSNASTPITITVGGAGSTPTIVSTKDGICVGESVTLTASNCTGSLSWSTGVTTSSITVSPTSTTSYNVTCSVNNCGGNATKVISVTPKPTAPIVTCGKERICAGESLTFVANGCAGTVTWSTGATGATMVVNPTVTTTYTAICTVNGCASSPSKDAIITVLNQNPPTITASAETVCNGSAVILTVSNCDGTVLWSTGSTAGTISVTPTVATTYTVRCIVDECSSSASKTINIGNGQAPNAPVIALGTMSPCDGTTTITASGCTGTVKWSNGATGNSITVSGGSYTATCSNGCGVSGNSNILNVPVVTIPAFIITASNETVCSGGSATLTANGCSSSVLWSTGATTASITVTPTATTTYTVTCNNQCAAKATKTINIGSGQTPNAPIISTNQTSVCGNETAKLIATGCTSGTITWSNGSTGSTISVSAGTYTATCKTDCGTSGNSNAIVINSGGQTPNAPVISTNRTSVCGNETATLTATGCTGGTITWSNGATGSSILVSAGTYTATCKTDCGTSGNSNAIIINSGGQAPSAPFISTNKRIICGTETATLSATGCPDGTITWSNGATGSSITVGTGTYTATCKTNCGTSIASLPLIITTIPVPSAPVVSSNKTSICGDEKATLTATGCIGKIVWNSSQTVTTATIIAGPGTYSAKCVNECGESSVSNAIIITSGGAGSTPTIASTKDGICVGESVTLTASNCTGSLSWSTGATTSSITVSPTVNTTYEVTCSVTGCSGKASKAIIVTPKPATPIVTCGKERICAGESLTFTAHGCEGKVTWSNGATGATMVVTPTATTIYTAICTVNGCASSPSKDAVITVINQTPPTLTASAETVCSGGSVTLTASNCDGTVLWSTGATSAAITVTPTIATTYTVKCIVDECESSASKTINIGGEAPNTPVISTNKITVCGNETATLTATGCAGSVIWNNGATGSTINVGAGTYTATCKNDCGVSGNSNAIVIQSGNVTPPTISASTTALCETGQVTLTAAGCAGTVIWSNTSTGSSITVSVATTTTFSAACKTATCESGKSNDVTITVGKPNKPTITGSRLTVCAGDSVLLNATGCEGTTVWSNGLTGASIVVRPTTTTNYTAVCKLPQGGCTSDQSNSIAVNVISKADSPVISCTASRICKGDTLTLNALGCSGSVLWSTGQTSASINVNPAITTVYTAICKVGSCESAPSAAATITVGNPIPPVVTCKNTQICGGSSTQIEAAGCTGTVKWSDGQIGAVITVSPTSITSYSAICDGGTCQSEKSNVITVQVTGSGLTKPTTRDLVNTCPFVTVDLTTGVSSAASSQGGIFVFRTGTTPGSPAVTNPSTAGTGTYYVFEKAGNGCYSEAAKINVNITTCEIVNPSCVTNPATAMAGKDTTVCLSTDFLTLQGKIGGAASSAKWTTDGKGTFDNALSLNTKYNYSNDDVVKGSVKFTLTTNDPDDNGSCVAATSSFTVTLKGVSTVPTIESSKSPNICFGDSVVLTATNAGSYKWSTGATTKSITVKTPGRYTVKLINDGGCASLSSSEIVVKLSDAIATPVVTAITKNNCPATTVNLASSVTSQTQSTGGAFEFHTGSSPSSPMLANASAVGSGTYYVIEKSGTGCYSQASPIIVTIDKCETTTDTSKVDVSIQIIGSRVELKIGDPVTYTITVKNNSTVKAATNVNVVNVLPKGFTITSTTPGFTAFGTDSLLSVIGNLPAGATKTYTYDAKTTKAGQIINTAKITKLDQIDQILSNNISQWTVECKTCQETCVGLALAADTTRQVNGSYNITFRALIEACGNVKLEGVKITENLSTMFPAPTTFTIVQKPTAGVGSLLKPNDSFNGSTDLNLTIPEGSIVEAGKVDTIKFVINIVPNGKEGPFSTNAIVAAIGNTAFGIPQDVSDVSNNGKTVVKESAEPTVVRLYKSPSVGLAKIVLDTTKKANGSYDITYQLLVKNNGSLTLNDVIVRDTLSKVFKAPATFTVVAAPSKNTSSQLALNSAFNGTTDTRLTLASSTIAIGKTDTLKFTVNVRPDTLKAFANTAVVSGSGTLTSGTKENVTDLSNAGLNPDAPGSNPTNLNLNSEGGSSIEVPCIGIALYVKDTVRQADSSYNITYKAILKNCGNLNLSSIQVCDTLSKTFTSPAIAKLAVKPTVSAGSLLKVDTSYNGTTKTCMLLDASQLAPNKVDTLTWVVNVKLNGNKGPFRNTVIVTAKTPSGQTITDASNAGVNPDPSGNTPTVINFNSLPEALIGISKSASVPKLVTGTTNTYDVTFTFKVKNYGKVAFTGVQIQDNLSVVFGDSIKIDSVKVTADAGLTANSSFTGRGNLINLLVDSLSTLPANTDKNVTLFTRLTTTASKANFENQALVIGKYPTNKSENDLSTNGNDPDPDADGTPKNNSLPTPVKLGDGGPIIPSFSTTFGIAKAAILDTVKNSDGSYNLSYKVIVKNYGTRKLTNVQLSDSLVQVFADSANFTLVGKPVLSKNSKLKVDTSFNGRGFSKMLIADSSSLAAGAADTLTFKLRLLSAKKGDATYSNSITGTAKDSTTNVRDISQAGLNPDPDADNNPGNNNLPTVITIKGQTAITDTTNRGRIPQAFSPNSDGKNDLFVIKGINGVDDVEAEIFIYNRWGQLVYQNTDFAKVEGWNGEANNGIVLGGKGVGVPDGTYFICVKAAGFWENKPQVTFITIAR